MRGKTLMKYSIPAEGQINIQLLSIDGQVISNLINEAKPAGEGAIEFDGEAFKPGYHLLEYTYDATDQAKIICKLII